MDNFGTNDYIENTFNKILANIEENTGLHGLLRKYNPNYKNKLQVIDEALEKVKTNRFKKKSNKINTQTRTNNIKDINKNNNYIDDNSSNMDSIQNLIPDNRINNHRSNRVRYINGKLFFFIFFILIFYRKHIKKFIFREKFYFILRSYTYITKNRIKSSKKKFQYKPSN